MTRRADALTLLNAYVPSRYGDERFAEIIKDGWAPGFGTTCGHLTSWLLWRLGCTDPRIVNRNEPDRGLAYHTGQNMSRLVGGAKALGAYRTRGTPSPGDLYFVFRDPPRGNDWGNHVGVVLSVSDDGTTWHTADAGQGSARDQEAKFLTRSVQPGGVPKMLVGGEWRYLHFIDIDAIPLGVPPLPIPGIDGSGGGGAWSEPPGPGSPSSRTGSGGGGLIAVVLAVIGLAGLGGLWRRRA